MQHVQASRAHTWLESGGDWAWPGRSGSGGTVAAELLPPPWVPAFPRRLEPAAATVGAPGAWVPQRGLARRLAPAALLAGLAAVCAALALSTPIGLGRLVGVGSSRQPATGLTATSARSIAASPPPLPTVVPVSRDAAGSSIDSTSYSSAALHGAGSFLLYLPPGYASTTARYPVIYLLHGNDETDSSFLQIGLQNTLDGLISRHLIPPVIAVMIQGGPGTNNWLNLGDTRYEAYVLEVQSLIDRMLPTVPDRAARAIAGYSMGGYGAMHLALTHPERFAVVESWLGFFNGLDGQLQDDRAVLSHLGLRAFIYGGAADDIANPAENAPFAAALRAAGADAHSAVYPGEHDFATLEAHLAHMLAFAGRSLSAAGQVTPR